MQIRSFQMANSTQNSTKLTNRAAFRVPEYSPLPLSPGHTIPGATADAQKCVRLVDRPHVVASTCFAIIGTWLGVSGYADVNPKPAICKGSLARGSLSTEIAITLAGGKMLCANRTMATSLARVVAS